jgi:PAS domain S-box-containing protein
VGVSDDSEPSFGPPELFSAISQAANRSDLGIMVTRWSTEAPILYVNEALAQLVGRTTQDLLGQTPWGLLLGEEGARLREMHEERLRGRRVPGKLITQIRRASGMVPVEISANVVGLGSGAVTVCFVEDITDQLRAEEELRSSEARFAQLLDSAPDGVIMLRGEQVLSANRVAAGMLGSEDAEQLSGQSLRLFVTPHAHSALDELSRVSDGSEGRHTRPILLTTIDGRSLEVSAVPMKYEGQGLVLAFLREVTERDAMHARLVQAERLAAIGLLASGVVHEINNPLTYVLLHLQYLHKELPKAAFDPQRVAKLMHHLEEASHGASRVQNIVKDLRSFSRSEGEALVAVDLHRVVEAAVAMVQPEFDGSVKLDKDVPPGTYVLGIAPKMEQVVLNLLTNAAHALVDDSAHAISVRAVSPARGKVYLTVTDSGPGVPDDVKERVFDPFFTTKPRGKGTGLGLPICRSIIDSFGGRIWFSDAPEGGAQVNIELLASAAPERIPEPASSSPGSLAKARGVKPTVLIIDDERPVVTMLARFLESSYDVRHTTVPDEALTLLSAQRFDVILCDVMMPGMSGIDLYRAAQERSPGSERRMVFMTGGGLHPEIYEFLRDAERPKLEKPFDIQELKRVLQQVADS